jgi:CxxC motif-containing protein
MKLVFWGLVAVALAYLAYSGMIAVSSWISVNNAVDEIVSAEGVEMVPSRELKRKLMTAANEAGVPLSDKDVVVTNVAGQGVNVEVLWTVPVVVVNGDAVVAVPLAVRRSSAKK